MTRWLHRLGGAGPATRGARRLRRRPARPRPRRAEPSRAAILVDATVVRMVLVPASMALLGRWNWWLPAWLDRLLPHLDLDVHDDESEPALPAPDRLPAGVR